MKKYSIKILSLVSLLVIQNLLLLAPTKAQSASGTLSFSPTSVEFAEGETKSVSIVYTGTDITAAEVHVEVGAGLEITNFTEGSGLVFIINSPENGEVHVGKLSEGNITSGSTLFTMDVQATACDQDETISFNEEEVLVPDVSMSFNDASYTINCGGGGDGGGEDDGGGDGGGGVATPSTLPKTGVISDNIDKIVTAVLLTSTGAGIFYYKKLNHNIKPEVELINL